MNNYEWITTLLAPVTGVVTWLATRRKRRNDALGEMQNTIDMLVQQNKTLYKELIDTRRELAEARTQIAVLGANQEKLLKENSELRAFMEQKSKQ